jgi:hypothetical protein
VTAPPRRLGQRSDQSCRARLEGRVAILSATGPRSMHRSELPPCVEALPPPRSTALGFFGVAHRVRYDLRAERDAFIADENAL